MEMHEQFFQPKSPDINNISIPKCVITTKQLLLLIYAVLSSSFSSFLSPEAHYSQFSTLFNYNTFFLRSELSQVPTHFTTKGKNWKQATNLRCLPLIHNWPISDIIHYFKLRNDTLCAENNSYIKLYLIKGSSHFQLIYFKKKQNIYLSFQPYYPFSFKSLIKLFKRYICLFCSFISQNSPCVDHLI